MHQHEEEFCPLVPVIITCRIHGNFTETPLNHLLGYGCPICDRENPDALAEKLHAAFDKLMS